MKKIGIIGSGAVGQALGSGFVKHNYPVMLGSEHLSKLEDWKAKTGEKGQVGSFAEAAAFGEIVVLAVKGDVAKEALNLAGAENLNGKTIIDATNPIAPVPHINGVLKFFTTIDNSLMEQLQAAFREANFVKAFNSIGSALMVNPNFGGIKPTMFICGNSETAKAEVSQILDRFGFETEDMGKDVAARAIEPLCMLWCIPGITKNQWKHGFKLLKAK